MYIDAHQHFWKYDPKEYDWISEDMQDIRKDFMPDDLKPLLQKLGFAGSVAVQARTTVEETEWLLQLSDQYEHIMGVVGWVDLCSPEVEKDLERFAKHPKFKGVRHVVQGEPDDRFMLREEFLRGLSLLKQYHLTYDLLLFPKHLPVASEVVKQFPEQKFVLDHLAKPFIADGIIEPWAAEIQKLAKHKNVYCKVSGMVTEAKWHDWKAENFKPYLDVVFESFGCDRLMIGSDWPVCTVSQPYDVVMRIVMDYIQQFSAEEQAAVLGGNCRAFYNL
ncbi:amidohydrolase family protein [Marinicrinis lubricantis]|uniref:Amidohydrolase family protein n=1 Tax=Marinicrinis lubricantis TaxID=2086470 RepID=A0ABW1IVR6_9BACL